MDQRRRLFIGLDVSKLKISVAVADGERGGEVRFFGDIPSDPASVSSIVQRLADEEQSSTSVTRQGRQVTNSTVSSPRWAMIVWWWHRPSFPSVPEIE